MTLAVRRVAHDLGVPPGWRGAVVIAEHTGTLRPLCRPVDGRGPAVLFHFLLLEPVMHPGELVGAFAEACRRGDRVAAELVGRELAERFPAHFTALVSASREPVPVP